MIYKPRTESTELLLFRSLNTRMNLSEKDKQYYYSLEKGYEGEVMFDTLTEKLQIECLIVNDLLLKKNNTTFQIDSLIILSDILYLFEIKNFEGDFYYESDRLFMKNKSEVNNPLNQLSRCESLLRQLLQSLRFNSSISASVVFINPEFTLYQSPLNKPFIFPTQVRHFLRNLDRSPSKLNAKHKQLADELISQHITESPYSQLPSYHFNGLRKGMTCSKCNSFSISIRGAQSICHQCGHTEKAGVSIMRSVQEFKLLFPDEKITTNSIHDWCKVVQSKKRISRILDEHFKIVGVHQWSYYE